MSRRMYKLLRCEQPERKPEPARVWILPALHAPKAVVLRRGPSNLCNVLLWDVEKGIVESGDWMRGRLFPLRCDFSPDGNWLVYLTMTRRGWCAFPNNPDAEPTFNAVSRPPSLKVAAKWRNEGTWFGGGLWRTSSSLEINIDRMCGNMSLPQIHFREGSADAEELASTVKMEVLDPRGFGEDEGVLYWRLERDGWRWVTPGSYAEFDRQRRPRQQPSDSETVAEFLSDAAEPLKSKSQVEFAIRPSKDHPTLRLVQLPYNQGRHFRFSLDAMPELLDDRVQWACYDATASLLFARDGVLERRTLDQLNGRSQEPPFRFDLNPLKPPAKF